jgi:hypothetical protein
MNNLTLHPASLESTFWHSEAHCHRRGGAGAAAVAAADVAAAVAAAARAVLPVCTSTAETRTRWRLTSILCFQGTGLTFQAWIKPEELHRSQGLGDARCNNGWALMLTCNEGSGAGCCGNHLTHAPGTLMFWNVEQVPQADASDVCRDAPTSTRRVVKDKVAARRRRGG